MFSTPRIVICLALFFIAHCLAFPFAEVDHARSLHARQAAASAAATAANVGSEVAGNIIAVRAAGATASSASVTATSANAIATNVGSEVASNVLAVLAAGASVSSASAAAAAANTDVGSIVAGNLLAVLAAGENASSTSAAAAATAGGGEAAITVTLSAQPSLCTTSDVQYSTKTAIPTGQVQIFPDQNAGWGTTGSIWNFTLDDGVGFSQLTASCQGSSCTGTSAEQSGHILENPDGVWTLNVTVNMDPAVTVIGITSGGNPVNGKFDLDITSTPPCALPVAQTCTNGSFNPSSQQWAAWSTDPWLAKYANTNDIQSFGELYDHLTEDFIEPTQRGDLQCEPGTGYSCEPPATSADCSSTQGLLVLWGVIRISNVLNLLWATFDLVHGDVEGWVDELVTQFTVPKVKQSWEAIVTAASSIVGILIFFFILFDALAPEAAAPASGIGVAFIVGLTNTIGSVSNFANGFLSQPADDTYLKYTGEYSQGISDYTSYMKTSITTLWRPSDPSGFGTNAVLGFLKEGAWTNILNPIQESPGIQALTENFFDILLVTSLINMVWKSNDFYVVFVPYGTVSSFQTKVTPSTKTQTFTIDDCTNHWVNDPNRPNYISCSLNYGGTAGMTILAQPASEKGGTLPLSEAKFSESSIGFTFNNDDALQSSLTGNAQYGFNYNFTTADMNDTLEAGAINLSTDFASIPLNSPGLYNLDVCVVDQLSYVPGAREYLRAGNGNIEDYIYLDPCICASFTSHGQKFADVAIPKVVAAVTTDPGNNMNASCVGRIEEALQ